MILVTRSQWGARAPSSTTSLSPSLQKGLAFHWEGPRMGSFTHDRCAGKVKGIQDYHMDTKRWADIAYNFVVCPHGYVFEGRGWGNRSAANGTNAANGSYLAVCYLGGEGDPFTEQAKTGFRWCRSEWERLRGRKADIKPHSSFVATACPGNTIRSWIASGMGGSDPAPPPPPPPPSGDTSYEVDVTITTVNVSFVTDGSGSGWARVPHQIDKIVGVLPPGLRPGADGRYKTAEVGLAQEDPSTIVSVTGWDVSAPCTIRLRVAS